MTGVANDPAFEPASATKRGHVESYFIKLNSPDGARALWLRWTLFVEPGRPARAECWGVSFVRGGTPRAFKRSMPLRETGVRAQPFGIDFDGTRFDGTHAAGEILSGASRLTWDFTLVPRVPALELLPFGWMYRARFPETKLTSPVPDALAAGWFEIDGERVDVSAWRGMQGHNWGTRHANRYAWCQAAGFDGEAGDSVVFEGVSAKLLRAGVELPWMSIAFVWIDGRWIRFDTPRAIAGAHTETSVLRWTFSSETDGYKLSGDASARHDETVGLHYNNPDGAMTYCLNSKLATLALRIETPRETRTFTTSRAALEIGWPTADHGIAMRA